MNEHTLTQLERLTALKEKGAINAQEFERQKAILLQNSPRSNYKPPMKKNTGWGWVGAIAAFLLLFAVISGAFDTPTPENEKVATHGPERFFSPWDGSHRGLERAIKSSLNDPDSYEHVETKYGQSGSTINVTTKFRAKNGFGAVITKTATGTISSTDGSLIDYEIEK